MAKAAVRTTDSAELPITGPVTTTLTYLPVDGDPVTNKWCGITFRANVPVELTGHHDGSEREQLNMWMIENAKGSSSYAVGNNSGPSRRSAAFSKPTTADQYRAYMIAWLQDSSIQHADQLIARFARDREVQASCEVGSDDYAYLATLFMPKLHDMAKADELTEGQVAQLWVNHGINQLPW